jgi:hypothetical protein
MGAVYGCTALTSVTFAPGSNISFSNFNAGAISGPGSNPFYDLKPEYFNGIAGGAGTYTRDPGGSVWTKQ